MNIIEADLRNLQSKIFKLLPMREAYDNGYENHLPEYIDNLCANYSGALESYPELIENREIIEVKNNLYFMRSDPEAIAFSRWRSMVLRSTRLIHTVLTVCYGEV